MADDGWGACGASILSVTLQSMGRGVLILAAALCGAISASLARQTPSEEAQVRAACGTCHALPPADVLPRASWPAEVAKMMYLREGRLAPIGRNLPTPVLPADMQQALAYY